MKYYKVKPEFGGTRIYKFARGGGLHIDGEFVANELYTPGEIKNIFNDRHLIGKSLETVCELVEIPKTRVYWMFGARFECKVDAGVIV